MTNEEKYQAIIDTLKRHGIGPNKAKSGLQVALHDAGRSALVTTEVRTKSQAAYTDLFALDFGLDE